MGKADVRSADTANEKKRKKKKKKKNNKLLDDPAGKFDELPLEKRRKKGPGKDVIGESSDFYFEKLEGQDLTIHKVETSKDMIKQPPLAADERKIIPPLGSSVVISGKSGSGKSTLLQNLITDGRFYGKSKIKPDGWFDKMFLFSPTAGSDDVLRSLGIPKNHVFTDLKEAPDLLKVIQESQKSKLEGGNKAHKVDQFLVIFDDIIGDVEFMNTEEFVKMFYMVRHLNCTTMICTQHFNRVPKICRLQASFIHFFAGSAAEVEVLTEQFAPPLYSKKEFIHLVNEATKGDHAFLTICMKVGWKYRFRRNLDEFIHLPRLEDDEEEDSDKENKDKDKTNKNSTISEEQEAQRTAEMQRIGKSSPGFYETPKQVRANVKALVAYYKAKSDGQNEQARRVLGEWAHKGPRGRIVF